VAGLGGAAAPGGSAAPSGSAAPRGSAGPGDAPGPGPSLLWCIRLIQHDRDKFSRLGASACISTRCELA
jgi:hypothetical protein